MEDPATACAAASVSSTRAAAGVGSHVVRVDGKGSRLLPQYTVTVPMAAEGVERSMSSSEVGAEDDGYTSDAMGWLVPGADGGMVWHLSELRNRWEDFCESDALFAAQFEAEMPAYLEGADDVLDAHDQCALWKKEVEWYEFLNEDL